MKMKGLFEWKILAAIFAVLIVLSSAFAASSGVKDFFFNLTSGLGGFMKGSPFGQASGGPVTEKTPNYVTIMIVADNITLNMDSPVNITTGRDRVDNFKGTLNLVFDGNASELIPSGTDLRLNLVMTGAEIAAIKIPKLAFKGVDFSVTSEKTNITATGDDIEITGFNGDIRITDYLTLTGNVTKAGNDKWSIG